MLLAVAVDSYIYFAVQRLTSRRFWTELQLWSAVAGILAIAVLLAISKKSVSDEGIRGLMWVIFALFSVYLPKTVFTVVDLLASVPRLWGAHRLLWLEYSGFGVASLAFLLMWWGALVNRFRIQVKEVNVSVDSLPPAFEGFRIAQISDLHTGTFASDTTFVARLVDRINACNPDLIVFTGDMVNRSSSELQPFVSALGRLNARYGVYSVLGNHDYGDYTSWPSAQAKRENLKQLILMQRQMGWHMLNNTTRWLRCGNDSIALIGVENVGDPPFRTYGDLRKAYPDITDPNTKILLSHNPAHWVADLGDNPGANIALTLAGHTHAMQFELFGLSPAALRYPTWGGLYTDSLGRHLYVNIGCGEVGFPARVGATPEITVLTLTGK